MPQCLRIYSPVIPHHSGSWWASPSEPTLVSGSLERGSTGGHTFSVPCQSARVMTPTSKTSLLLHVLSFPLSSTYSCAFILTTFPSLICFIFLSSPFLPSLLQFPKNILLQFQTPFPIFTQLQSYLYLSFCLNINSQAYFILLLLHFSPFSVETVHLFRIIISSSYPSFLSLSLLV